MIYKAMHTPWVLPFHPLNDEWRLSALREASNKVAESRRSQWLMPAARRG